MWFEDFNKIREFSWNDWQEDELKSFPIVDLSDADREIYNSLFFNYEKSDSFQPDEVYVNMPLIFAWLALDLENDEYNINMNPSFNRETHEKSWRETPLTIVLENNWTYYINWNYLEFLLYIEPIFKEKWYNWVFSVIKQKVVNSIKEWKSKKDIALEIIDFLKEYKFSNVIINIIENCIKKAEHLNISNYEKKPKIKWFYFEDSWFIDFNDRNKLEELLSQNEAFNLLWSILSIQEDYIYRAIRPEEWKEIKNNRSWQINAQTNFEKEIWAQVSKYAKTEWYAWIVIRVKTWNKKRNYKYWWLQVPRIECYAPYNIKWEDIEILWENWEWILLNEYLDS